MDGDLSSLVSGVDGRICCSLKFATWPFSSVVENQWAYASRRSFTPVARRDTRGTIHDWSSLLGDCVSDLELVSETSDPNWVVISKFSYDVGPSTKSPSLSYLRSGLHVPRVPKGRTVRVIASTTGRTHGLGYKEIQGSREHAMSYGDRESRALSCSNRSGKWEFLQFNHENLGSSPEWFENPEYYDKRGARKKFNRDILIEYCERIGLDITNPDFYRGRIAVIGQGKEGNQP